MFYSPQCLSRTWRSSISMNSISRGRVSSIEDVLQPLLRVSSKVFSLAPFPLSVITLTNLLLSVDALFPSYALLQYFPSLHLPNDHKKLTPRTYLQRCLLVDLPYRSILLHYKYLEQKQLARGEFDSGRKCPEQLYVYIELGNFINKLVQHQPCHRGGRWRCPAVFLPTYQEEKCPCRQHLGHPPLLLLWCWHNWIHDCSSNGDCTWIFFCFCSKYLQCSSSFLYCKSIHRHSYRDVWEEQVFVTNLFSYG